MDVEVFNSLSLDDQVKLAIKSRDPKVLDMIADSTCDYAKIFVARNMFTSFETLDKLATCPCRSVIDAILRNPRTQSSTKIRLQQAS